MSSRGNYQTQDHWKTTSQMRDEAYLNQLENISNKERFGLFSQPPGLSIGDKYQRPKTEQKPRGILTNPKMSSTVEPSLFQFPNFTSINDPYTESFKCKQIANKQREIAVPHDKPFKPTDKKKTVVGTHYEHMKEFDQKLYNTRNSDGSVITQPKNFYTQPYKKGFGNTTTGHLFEPVKYESDPFDRPKEFDIQDRADHRSKLLTQNKQFVSTQKRNQLFQDNMETYGSRPFTEGSKRSYSYKSVNHATQWKPGNPAKYGYNKTIGKFPEYKEQGEAKRLKKKQPFCDHNKTWKPNSQGTFQRPSPAISTLITNQSKFTSFRK